MKNKLKSLSQSSLNMDWTIFDLSWLIMGFYGGDQKFKNKNLIIVRLLESRIPTKAEWLITKVPCWNCTTMSCGNGPIGSDQRSSTSIEIGNPAPCMTLRIFTAYDSIDTGILSGVGETHKKVKKFNLSKLKIQFFFIVERGYKTYTKICI